MTRPIDDMANTVIQSQSIMGSTNTLTQILKILPFCRFVADTVLLVFVFFLLVIEKLGSFPDSYRVVIILALLIHWLLSALANSYGPLSLQFVRKTALRILFNWFALILCMLFFGFATKTTSVFSREVFLQWIVLIPLLQLVVWFSLKNISSWLCRAASQHNKTIVIGTGAHADNIVQALAGNAQTETFSGYVRDSSESDVKVDEGLLLGDVSQLRVIIKTKSIRKIYIALSAASSDRVQELEFELLDLNVDVVWVPDMRSYHLVNHSIYALAGNPAIAINQSPLTSVGLAPLYKSIMDKTLSLLAVVLLSPLFVIVAILVKMSSRGPVIFRQERHGFDGRIIKAWKFRTMYLHEEHEGEVVQAKKDDSRITPLGKILRASSIDELPQFFNVLQGSMSLVGPRPHALSHNYMYAEKIDSYLVRHRMKPGITGLAQINGYRGETDSLDKMKKRVELDLAYINNWSILLDVKILLKTPACLFRDEAY